MPCERRGLGAVADAPVAEEALAFEEIGVVAQVGGLIRAVDRVEHARASDDRAGHVVDPQPQFAAVEGDAVVLPVPVDVVGRGVDEAGALRRPQRGHRIDEGGRRVERRARRVAVQGIAVGAVGPSIVGCEGSECEGGGGQGDREPASRNRDHRKELLVAKSARPPDERLRPRSRSYPANQPAWGCFTPRGHGANHRCRLVRP